MLGMDRAQLFPTTIGQHFMCFPMGRIIQWKQRGSVISFKWDLIKSIVVYIWLLVILNCVIRKWCLRVGTEFGNAMGDGYSWWFAAISFIKMPNFFVYACTAAVGPFAGIRFVWVWVKKKKRREEKRIKQFSRWSSPRQSPNTHAYDGIINIIFFFTSLKIIISVYGGLVARVVCFC